MLDAVLGTWWSGAWVEVGSESDSPSLANWPGHAAGVEGFRVWLFDFLPAQLSQPHDIILSLNNALTL